MPIARPTRVVGVVERERLRKATSRVTRTVVLARKQPCLELSDEFFYVARENGFKRVVHQQKHNSQIIEKWNRKFLKECQSPREENRWNFPAPFTLETFIFCQPTGFPKLPFDIPRFNLLSQKLLWNLFYSSKMFRISNVETPSINDDFFSNLTVTRKTFRSPNSSLFPLISFCLASRGYDLLLDFPEWWTLIGRDRNKFVVAP